MRNVSSLLVLHHHHHHLLLLLLHLLLLLLVFCCSLPGANSDLLEAETAALLALKESWHDPNQELSTWILPNPNTSSPCLSWRGVTCNSLNTSVTGISLSKLTLNGTLSGAIGNLTSLETLILSWTNLTGPLPAEMSALSHLTHLDLRSNQFSGTLPNSIFIPNSTLKYLLLDNNKLWGEIPSSIGYLNRLRFLSATNNALAGPIPGSITGLPKLSAIYLGFNRLNGSIPNQIGDLDALLYLDLCSNSLTGPLPPELGSLSLLKRLNLSDNHLSGSIPVSWGNLSALTELWLSDNNLTGEVPRVGALAKFSNVSFLGNPGLCGAPLDKKCPSLVPPLSPSPVPGSGSAPPPPPPHSPDTPALVPQPGSNGAHQAKVIASSVGVAGLCIITVILILFMLQRRRRRRETLRIQTETSPDFYPSPLASDNGNPPKLEMFVKAFKYNYEEVVSHAGFYDTAHVVGKGRFATVFRSDLPNGITLAVKVFKHPIPQQAFEKEIVGLETVAGQFYTLLPIQGLYANSTEKVIFYNFVPRGTLYNVLHGNPDDAFTLSLDWTKRLHIAIGIAQAIVHLHRGSSIRILHKDLKSSNVLLDDKFLPLVADYGLIGLVSEGPWVETPGYSAPELRVSRKYTEKTDVYSFGVVLLELLTGKKPVSYIGNRELNLVTWVTRLWKDGRGSEVLGSHLVESCSFPDYPERALNLAVLCLSEHPAQRPSMSEIASILEGLTDANSPMRSPCLRPERPLLL